MLASHPPRCARGRRGWLGAALALSLTGLPRPALAQSPLARAARIVGVVRDTPGRPVAGAEVLVGVHRLADRAAPGACEDLRGGLLAAARLPTDVAGRYGGAVPRPLAGPAGNCVRRPR
jgi:hypothetical protein